MSKKLDSKTEKKEVCKHKNTSSSSDPLIWYICHDCGAHLNQKFEVIPASYHAIVNEVLKTEKKEMKYIEKDIKDFKLDEPIVFTNPKFDVPKHLKGSKTEKKGIITKEEHETFKKYYMDSKTEKIDSETLKKIKNLAQEESDFYDKHGYYSFWSDKLKVQRIKEKLLESKEEKCRLIKNAKNDPNWDGSLNAELCKGDCETCPYNESKANEPEKEYDGILAIQAMLNHEHLLVEQHKRDIQKLIEEFLVKIKDLYFSLDCWNEDLMFAEAKQEYEGRLKNLGDKLGGKSRLAP